MDRTGVLLLFYDISVETKKGKMQYRELKKELKKEGYLTLQKSIFYKIVSNISMSSYEINRIKSIVVTDCNVLCLPLSFGTFEKMISIKGELPNFVELRENTMFI